MGKFPQPTFETGTTEIGNLLVHPSHPPRRCDIAISFRRYDEERNWGATDLGYPTDLLQKSKHCSTLLKATRWNADEWTHDWAPKRG